MADSLTRSKMWVEDGKLYSRLEEDVGPILEQNQRDLASGKNDKAEFRHAARVPETVLLQFLQDEGATWFQFFNDPNLKAKFYAKLNDREFSKLRTWRGRL